MKIIRNLLFLTPLLFMMGCYWEMPEKITGNGDVITEERQVSNFDGIKVSCGIDVYTKKVYLTYVNLNKIGVSSAGDVKAENTLNTDKLKLSLSSAGDIRLDVVADEIYVNISSSGNANLSGKTNYLKAGLSSAGDLNAFDLKAKIGDINVSSAGDAKVFITEEASFSSSSAGDIIYKGDPDIKHVSTSSAGSIKKK